MDKDITSSFPGQDKSEKNNPSEVKFSLTDFVGDFSRELVEMKNDLVKDYKDLQKADDSRETIRDRIQIFKALQGFQEHITNNISYKIEVIRNLNPHQLKFLSQRLAEEKEKQNLLRGGKG